MPRESGKPNASRYYTEPIFFQAANIVNKFHCSVAGLFMKH